MKSRPVRALVAIALGAITLLSALALPAPAAPIAVRYLEGVTHGFLVLRGPRGATAAKPRPRRARSSSHPICTTA